MSDHSSDAIRADAIRIVRMPGPALPALVEFDADHSGSSADCSRTYAYRQVTSGSYHSVWFVQDLSDSAGTGYLLEWRSKRGYVCSCAGFSVRKTCRHVAGMRAVMASVRDAAAQEAAQESSPVSGEENRAENRAEQPGIF